MLRIRILFFGKLKEYFGEEQYYDIAAQISVANLTAMLVKNMPLASDTLLSAQVAVDNAIEDNTFLIGHACEIAYLPPFSGG